ncbi:Ureidoglycolate lyase [Poriferisphaera corsica]|uniref:Ureidoglycolate lyase n=1 Tax=Poriferisphaera corsica TaxID=2528020 RepID=A0A517YWE2_9BACT|nr:fumarylacetoacetate hydrolase family protein [Poriferisphaera corsica]QDU34551.1 Ureidoglycolate lyase [Poriferisphaera corsica]
MAKIARILHNNQPTHALVESEGFRLIEGDIFSSYKPTDTIIPTNNAKLLAPVDPPQVICIGANYRKHCIECNAPIPELPLVFFKLANAVAGPNDPIIIPKIAPDNVDWEAELVIVIGKKCKNISEDQVDAHILGYTCGNDISARDVQLKIDKLWGRGKSMDNFAPIGPWIATDLDGDNLDISLTLNGETRQNSNSSDLIFSCRHIASYLSHSMTLLPGTIIMTGTPSGVGMSANPQRFLKEGDKLTVSIQGIGELHNHVINE